MIANLLEWDLASVYRLIQNSKERVDFSYVACDKLDWLIDLLVTVLFVPWRN